MLPLLLSFLMASAQAAQPDPASLAKEADSLDWQNAVSESVVIHAPLEVVWKYGSDSLRAREWSIYFDHITPLKDGAPDGTIGAIRRCFRNPNETGLSWDEMTVESIPGKLRRLYVYNFHGARLSQPTPSFASQIYEDLGNSTTKFTFQTQIAPGASYVERVIYYFTAKQAHEVFLKNLENIKAAIEEGPRYHRVHEYIPFPSSWVERAFVQ